MIILDIASGALIAVGVFFFAAGTAGLLRFPDVYSRLHALTKADNTGVGFIVAGLCLQSPSAREIVLLLAIWLLVLLSGVTACQLVARRALKSGLLPWSRSQ